MAIETVGQAKEDQLTHMLIDYLMGEEDGIPKVQRRQLDGGRQAHDSLHQLMLFVLASFSAVENGMSFRETQGSHFRSIKWGPVCGCRQN